MSGGIRSPFEKASELGRVVVTPGPNELFVDIDDREALEWYWIARDILDKHNLLARTKSGKIDETITPSPSGKADRFHVRLRLTHELPTSQRIAYQAALGSDLMRELLSLVQAERGEPAPVVFFELPPAASPAPKHACELCTGGCPVPAEHRIPHSEECA